jgi:hypothetical protein
MAIRSRRFAGEIVSGTPSATSAPSPAVVLDIDTGKFYYKPDGTDTYSLVNVGTADAVTGLDATAAELNATSDLSALAVAVTATSDGLTTGTIAERGVYQFVQVTSANSTDIVVLPAPTPGRTVVLNVGANGFKLKSSAPATVGINGGTGASAVSAIAASSTCVMTCVSATSWKGFFMDADSDVAKVAAAA